MNQSTTYANRGIGRFCVWFLLFATFAFGFFQKAEASSRQRIKHVITSERIHPPSLGRDLWFALPQNYHDQSGKYFQLYVTSPNNTTVHVELPSGPKSVQITAMQVASIGMPLGNEMKSSSVVENKGIRVWSKDADLACYVMSHNPYTSDGFYVIPNIGWGTDYVVAAYESLFEGFGTYVFDFPSEFTVVANQDHTVMQVTPTMDIRGPGSNTVAVHPQGKTFTEFLDRGQSVQYQLTQAQDADNYDVTGTIVHSNNPVGVIGASQCPNIPPDFPYCDHVCEMIPPTRTWAKTYYSTNFFQTDQGHDASTFLVIGTKAGQTIRRYDAAAGLRTHCILGPQYDHFWDPNITKSSRWESDDPFLLVQYINSSTYPNGSNGNGDPAEVVINPVEQYFKTTVFQTPSSLGAQSPYINYVNVAVNDKDQHVTFDGKNIKQYTKQAVDGLYSVYRLSNIKPGAHVVVSDSGTGVYIYGYSFDESYAWTGAFGTGTFNSPDTVPPLAVPSGLCFDAHVSLSDLGPLQSKLSSIRIDTVYNMAYLPDQKFVEGAGTDSSFYDMFVIDNTKEAYLSVTTNDLAGNKTTVVSTYQPQVAIGFPTPINFGTGNLGGPAVYQYATIKNIGKNPFNLDSLDIILKTQGFSIDSGAGVGSTIKAGDSVRLKIAFIPTTQAIAYDTLVFGDGCIGQPLVLQGTGGAPDFSVTNDDFGTHIGGIVVQNQKVTLTDLSSKQSVSIDAITTDNPAFQYLASDPRNPQLPFTINPGTPQSLWFAWTTPAPAGPYNAHGFFTSKAIKTTHSDSLYGIVEVAGNTFFADTVIDIDCPRDGDSVHLKFSVLQTGQATSQITSLVHGPTSPGFVNLRAIQGATPVDPNNSKVYLSTNQTMDVYEDFALPANVSGTYIDSISAYAITAGSTEAPKLIKTIYARINTHYRDQALDQTALTFATVPYGSGVGTAQKIMVKNTATEDLTVNTVSLSPGPFNGSFAISTVPTLPAKIPAGQSLEVDVTFNADADPTAAQQAQLLINTDACNPAPQVLVNATQSYQAAVISGVDATPVSSCTPGGGSVTVKNPQKNITDKFVGEPTISGPDAAAFSIPTSWDQQLIPGQSSVTIPVTFTPVAQPGVRAYNAVVTVHLTSTTGDVTLTQPINATAASVSANASSLFAIASGATGPEAAPGTMIDLPVTVSVTKPAAISTMALTDMKIKGVRLNYTLNSDLLHIVNSDPTNNSAAAIAAAFKGNNGWTVDPSNSSLNGNNLTLVLTNGAFLDDGAATTTGETLGNLTFEVRLPKIDTVRNVTLNSMDLLQDNGNGYTVLTGCASTSVQSGQFTLIYQCGDITMQKVMANDPSWANFIKPATPNPVRGGNIKFSYATRMETPVTISIFDVLGNEVGRAIDHVQHQPGVYEVNYDVSSLPNGTYTYRLSGDRFQTSKQFVISR